MAHRSVIPFGPQHPVLPEPLHLDLVIEDDRVIEAIPQIGFVHRGLEKLTEKRDMHQFGYIAERICGICAVGHSCGYASACERMLDIEVPGRVQYIRTILHELSRIHSHLLWLGLLADAFGFEALFYRSWTLREQILKIFESTCGGRVILSINEIGGLKHDIEDSELAGIVQTLDAMRPDYEALVHTFLDDNSCGERLHGVGVISKKEALELSMVGPFGRASGVDYDVRMFGDGAYADLAAFEPIVATDGDCYARCQVRCAEVTQAMDIIKELVGMTRTAGDAPPGIQRAGAVCDRPGVILSENLSACRAHGCRPRNIYFLRRTWRRRKGWDFLSPRKRIRRCAGISIHAPLAGRDFCRWWLSGTL